jgi:Icc-related predicted phosphoesterase
MHEHSVAWLTEQIARPRDERIVVVTHHAPSIGSIPKRFAKDPVSASFSSDLDYLIKASGAPLWVHGHTHDSFDYRIGKTRIIANPRGYYGLEVNPQFNPGLVVEI